MAGKKESLKKRRADASSDSAADASKNAARMERVWTISSATPKIVAAVSFFFFLGFWGFRYDDLLYVAGGFDSLPIPFCAPLRDWCDFTEPAFLLSVCGHFIAAVSCWPMVAAVILASLSTALIFQSRAFWPREGRRGALSFIPGLAGVLLLTILIPLQEYYVFAVVPFSVFYACFFGFSAAYAATLLLRRICTPSSRFIAAAAFVVIFYPAAGFFALLTGIFATLDFGVVSSKNTDTSALRETPSATPRLWKYSLALFVWTALVPVLWYPYFSTRLDWGGIYIIGYSVGYSLLNSLTFEPAKLILTQILGMGALLFFLLPVLVSFVKTRWQAQSNGEPSDVTKGAEGTITPRNRDATAGDIAVFTALLLMLAGSLIATLPDENFFPTIKAMRPLEEGNWEKLLALESETTLPIIPLLEMRRLSLFRTGRAAEEFFDRTNDSFIRQDIVKTSSWRIYGQTLLFYYGNPNLATRTAMNYFIDTQNRSSYCVKTLCLCAIVERERALAEKYIDWLSRRIGCKAWARDALCALEALESGETPQNKRAAFWVEQIQLIRQLKPTTDYVDYNNTLTVTCCYPAAKRDTSTMPLAMVEMQLVQILQMIDMKLFTERFPAYYERLQKERPNSPIPKVLQQGAMMTEFYQMKRLPLTQYPYDAKLLERFRTFLHEMNTPSGPSAEQFADTWWLYFVTVKQKYHY